MSEGAEDESTAGQALAPSGFARRRRPESGVHVEREADVDPYADTPTRDMAHGLSGYVSRIAAVGRVDGEGSREDAFGAAVAQRPSLGWSLSSIPVVTMAPELLVKMPLDHRAGFFLAHVDGASTLETLLDIVPLPETEVIGLLESLISLGVVGLLTPSSAQAR